MSSNNNQKTPSEQKKEQETRHQGFSVKPDTTKPNDYPKIKPKKPKKK